MTIISAAGLVAAGLDAARSILAPHAATPHHPDPAAFARHLERADKMPAVARAPAATIAPRA